MHTLTHAGPGYRSKLVHKGEAADLARRLREDPHFTEVQLLESTRSTKRARYYVVCLPTCEDKRVELLGLHQEERIQKAQKEGPHLLWLGAPEGGWHVLSLSGEVYHVSDGGQSCTCRDGGVCADNGLLCKHAVALQYGLGVFITPELQARLRLLEEKRQQPPAPRQPVALPVAA